MSSEIGNSPSDFEKLLGYLKASRGFDFSTYKRSTLQRRIQKRMQGLSVPSYTEYVDYLEVHQDEFKNLFNTILINVTSFFRDAEAWQYIEEEVIPKLIGTDDSQVRVWVAGCASGEEAYSIAMLLAEQLGPVQFRDQVKIYATDLDDDALSSSRTATYSEKEIESVPPRLVEKYFEKANDRYVFDRELRRSVIFGKHDLIQDAPISRVDLLMCRNTLMYFNAETQERVLARFHFALTDGGFLFLGKAETLLTHTSMFAPLDMRNRVFSKVTRGRMRDRVLLFGPLGESSRYELNGATKLSDAAFETSQLAQMVVDSTGKLNSVNEKARVMFGLEHRDIGRPFQDLEVSYRPVELRSGIDQATIQRRSVQHKEIGWTALNGEGLTLNVTITPLTTDGSSAQGASITFEDVTLFKRLQNELSNFNQELETAYEEVQSTNEELQTTNEELQSTVEELETTNEELQSTNEELETINEELQSTNEELETINEELRERSDDLNRANALLESILAGLREGVIVVDEELRILAWNHQSEDLWGQRADETIGRYLLNLDIGLPVEQLRAPIRSCLGTGDLQSLDMDAINRRGRQQDCKVIVTPLKGLSGNRKGVIVLTLCTPV